MLPKTHRLTTKDFKEIFDHGKTFRGRYFTAKVVQMSATGPSLFGFSISKKNFKHAVDRNLYRRRGYASLSKLYASLQPSYKSLFILNKLAVKPHFKEMTDDLKAILIEAKVLK